MKFGECLNLLLSTLDISMNQLAKAINVDSSLVSRWVSGKRIPGYNTVYIESITEYLSKNIKNSFQEQRLNEIFMNGIKDNDPDENLKEKIRKLLLESQGYSIECKKKEQQEMKNKSNNKANFSKKQDNIGDDDNLIMNINNLNHFIDLSREDKIIFGTENIFSMGISLLEAAANHKFKDNKMIYITYIHTSFSINFNNLIYFRNVLLKCINNGWKIFFLLKLDNDIKRIIKFINFIHPLVITGGLNIYYFDTYGNSDKNRETFVVSGIGALSCFPTELHSEINCGFYLKTKSGVDILKNYLNVLLINHAKPMIKYYSKDMTMEYYSRLTEIENAIGNRFQYKFCFSMFTLTENLFEKLLKKKKLPDDKITSALDFYIKRLKIFLSNLQNYEYHDIYLLDSINDLVKYRKFYFHFNAKVEIMDLEVRDIIEILQNIIYLLETYDNYNIAFIPQIISGDLKNVDSYCLVKERQAVLFETFNPSKKISKIQLSIKEPMMVKAVYEYFIQVWEQIAPVNRNKMEIITILQNQINILKNSH